MEPRKFGYLSALLFSFFSGDFYRDVGRRWRGFGFWYLIWLLMVAWIPFGIYLQVQVSSYVANRAGTDLNGFPTVTINNGKVTSSPDPYIWADPHDGKPLVYVDTAGQFDRPEGAGAKVKLSQSTLEIQNNQYDKRTIDLSNVKHFYIDKPVVLGWIQSASRYVAAVIIGWGLTGSLIFRLLQILIFAGIAAAVSSGMRTNLGFGAVMRLTTVAMTPSMLVRLAIGFAHFEPWGISFLYLILEWVTIVLALRANRLAPTLPGGFTGYPPGYGAAPGGFPMPPPQPPQPPVYPPQA